MCKHIKTLDVIHDKIKTDRDYWLFTEIFCMLHDGNDSCNCHEKPTLKQTL